MTRRTETLAMLRPHVERARAMTGWSHSAVLSIHLDPGPPWGYEGAAVSYIARSRRVVDMGTGGGELLAMLASAASITTAMLATEEWSVNVPVAHERLAPLGIPVLHAQSLALPIASNSVDLVLNRHEELDPSEVARVLAPGGVVLTQQVGANNWPELDRFFPRRHDFGDLFRQYRDGFQAAGIEVLRAETYSGRVAFGSLGDIAYMMVVAPWDIPDFDAEMDLDALLDLEDSCRTGDGIVLTETRFLIEGRKP